MRLTLVCSEGVRRPPRITTALETLAARLSPAWLRVQLVLADDALLQRLNRRYRHKNRATDVLSFRYEDRRPSGGDPQAIHAEIYISVQRARRQAAERGHSLSREVVLLGLHGLLHLQGHDHLTSTQARRMRAAERPHLRWLQRAWGGSPVQPLVPVLAAREGSR